MRSPVATLTLLAAVSAALLSACAPEPAIVDTAQMTPLERGAMVFRKCRSCHTLGQGDPHRVGPNLHGVWGREAGALADFNYSRAMRESDVVWSDATMDAYLRKPAEYVPGTRMSFVGLKRDQDRADIIAYLRAETGAAAEAP